MTYETKRLPDYYRETLIEYLKRVAKILGKLEKPPKEEKTPSKDEYNRFGKASAKKVQEVFGTWNKGLRAAGLEPLHEYYTDEELFNKYDKVWKQLGREPKPKEVSQCGKPTWSTYKKRFHGLRGFIPEFFRWAKLKGESVDWGDLKESNSEIVIDRPQKPRKVKRVEYGEPINERGVINKQLLIDGVTYNIWTPPLEVEDLHPLVLEHIEDIFGIPSFHFTAKKTITSQEGKGVKPDGYVIAFGDTIQWHLVEIELSKHMEIEHIANQLMRFGMAVVSLKTRQSILDELYEQIKQDNILGVRFKDEVRKAKGPNVEIHEFLSKLTKNLPTITVIIEEYTDEVKAAIGQVKYAPIEIVEFQTFIKADVGISAHAHLIERMFESTAKKSK